MSELPLFLRVMAPSLAEVPSSSTLVAIGPTGTILWVSTGWSSFARENGGVDIPSRFGAGSSYFDAISEPLRSFYEDALGNALVSGKPFEQNYDCSSPATRRLHHLRALPFGGEGLLLEHSLVVEQPRGRTGPHPQTSRYCTPFGLVVQCSHCRRTRREDGGSWDWVLTWALNTPPNASHGICAACLGYFWGAAEGQGAATTRAPKATTP